MSTERVDKAWQRKGLKEYPTEAILGTLGHYGVKVAQEEFRQLAETSWPRGIGNEWGKRWKGVGQFSIFPWIAAEELWKRWVPEKLAPYAMSEGLATLMGVLGEMLQGSQQAAVGPAFQKMKELRERIPRDEKGELRQDFVSEVLQPFDENSLKVFNQMAEMLVRSGHVDDADEFAELEEAMLPERRGISRAVVRSYRGERDAAVEALQKAAAEADRPPVSRVMAVDALLHLKAWSQAAVSARPLLEEAERNADWHMALDVSDRLAHALRELGDSGGLQQLERDQARLEAAHDAAHPDHARRHHHH